MNYLNILENDLNYIIDKFKLNYKLTNNDINWIPLYSNSTAKIYLDNITKFSQIP